MLISKENQNKTELLQILKTQPFKSIFAATALMLFSATMNAQNTVITNADVLYGQETLTNGFRSRIIDNNNGCQIHILEAAF